MFCSSCGVEAAGNFCWKCGSKLGPPGGGGGADAGPTPTARHVSAETPRPWKDEIRYSVLVAHPEVRALLAANASQAKKGLTGEEFLALFDKLALLDVSLEKLVKVIHPIYTKLGIGTGKTRTEVVPLPAGQAIVGVLVSLARRGNTLRQVRQAEDGCLIEAAIPSDMWALEGDLLISVRRGDAGTTQVEAATKIHGQLFDWGKSKAKLRDLFADLQKIGGTEA